MKNTVILLAGGRGSRMGAGINKILLSLEGKTVIRRSVEAFSSVADEYIIVCKSEEKSEIASEVRKTNVSVPVIFAGSGETRQQSVRNGLNAFQGNPSDLILIHDAARCLVDQDLIRRVLNAAVKFGAAVPGIPASSTFKLADEQMNVDSTPDRSRLYEIQTPQVFTAEKIVHFAFKAEQDGVICTDDAGLLEYYGIPVRITDGSSANIKITEPQDLNRARTILQGDSSKMIRIGFGYDVHQLTAGRKLILCGCEIPYEYGLDGHSDADVALHALMDAMLGACSLGDIGRHFPDTDDRYKGISSVLLLRQTNEIIRKAGYSVGNVDLTIAAQKPRLSAYIPRMIQNLSDTLNIAQSQVNVKATTTEHLGFEGRGEGISSYAVCTVIRNTDY